MAITLVVNGIPQTVDVEPDTPLLWVLRDSLKLMGTKYGCGIAQCGACTVLINRKAVRSCSYPIASVAGESITTIEGLSADGTAPHPTGLMNDFASPPVHDVLWDLLEDVQLDAKQRQLIWPDAKHMARKQRLDLDQSVQRIQKLHPGFPRDEVEEFLLDWIDMGYDPENYSQAQLDELDNLTEKWVADHLRKAKRTRHS